MAYVDALKNLVWYRERHGSLPLGPCVAFSLECILPPRRNLPVSFYDRFASGARRVSVMLGYLEFKDILTMEKIDIQANDRDTKKRIVQILRDDDYAGIILTENATSAHAFSIQKPPDWLGKVQVYDCNSKKLHYKSSVSSIITRHLTRIPGEAYAVRKGEFWESENRLRRLK
jgi:hypothetical protein